MINWESYAKTAAVIGGFFAIRIIAGWRVDRRKMASMKTPLVDPVLLETTFAPRAGDDVNLLAEVRDTLAHLNRQAYAEEFWNVSDQIVRLDAELPKNAKVTLRAVLVRMLGTEERWLQIVAAKTSGQLKVTEASTRLNELLTGVADSEDAVDGRLKIVLTEALELIPADSLPLREGPGVGADTAPAS